MAYEKFKNQRRKERVTFTLVEIFRRFGAIRLFRLLTLKMVASRSPVTLLICNKSYGVTSLMMTFFTRVTAEETKTSRNKWFLKGRKKSVSKDKCLGAKDPSLAPDCHRNGEPVSILTCTKHTSRFDVHRAVRRNIFL